MGVENWATEKQNQIDKAVAEWQALQVKYANDPIKLAELNREYKAKFESLKPKPTDSNASNADIADSEFNVTSQLQDLIRRLDEGWDALWKKNNPDKTNKKM